MGMQVGSRASVTCDNSAEEDRGRTLHREFVGMVFALAIAEVAIQGAPIANADHSWAHLPAYSHLILATLIITTSWVGWGRSKCSESNIRSVFSKDFVELCVDLWLVAVYFFIVKGVDAHLDGDRIVVQPSLDNEAFWVSVALATYFIWDLITKCRTPELFQRAWASLTCAVVGVLAYKWLPRETTDNTRVVIGDISLAFLVLAFRAMKVHNFSELTRGDKKLIWGLLMAFIALGLTSTYFDQISEYFAFIMERLNPSTPAETQEFPVLTAP